MARKELELNFEVSTVNKTKSCPCVLSLMIVRNGLYARGTFKFHVIRQLARQIARCTVFSLLRCHDECTQSHTDKSMTEKSLLPEMMVSYEILPEIRYTTRCIESIFIL